MQQFPPRSLPGLISAPTMEVTNYFHTDHQTWLCTKHLWNKTESANCTFWPLHACECPCVGEFPCYPWRCHLQRLSAHTAQHCHTRFATVIDVSFPNPWASELFVAFLRVWCRRWLIISALWLVAEVCKRVDSCAWVCTNVNLTKWHWWQSKRT